MDINAAQIAVDGMVRFVERIAHKPAYSVRTEQCVSCVVILSCVRCEAGFCVDAVSCSISTGLFYVILGYITAISGRIHGCIANYVF
jgi:hypothetical protein